VVMSSDLHSIFDFENHIKKIKPDILVITDDDKNVEAKIEFCKKYGMELIVLKKRNEVKRVSTTSILSSIKNIEKMPLRIDFAGGWLDVPKFSKKGGFIVNCAISPLVSLDDWKYEKNSGLGGSAAYALLQAKIGVKAEIDMGVGWQDPVIISHTGLCVWRSGIKPILDIQINPDWLNGKMLIYWTNKKHIAVDHISNRRDYELIFKAGVLATEAVYKKDIKKLSEAINISYKVQIKEGMEALSEIKNALACKYLGAGYGGYALYIFETESQRDQAVKNTKRTMKIEPYIKEF
jgi:galactokinase/mevalonate kinase-like predicted kinase